MRAGFLFSLFAVTAGCVAVTSTLPGSAAVRSAPVCTKADGMIPGPYIPTAESAKAIFKVVAKAVDAGHKDKYISIDADDDGRVWTVVGMTAFPRSVPPPAGFETVEITTGGGGLTVVIDKCTGTITQAYFAK